MIVGLQVVVAVLSDIPAAVRPIAVRTRCPTRVGLSLPVLGVEHLPRFGGAEDVPLGLKLTNERHEHALVVGGPPARIGLAVPHEQVGVVPMRPASPRAAHEAHVPAAAARVARAVEHLARALRVLLAHDPTHGCDHLERLRLEHRRLELLVWRDRNAAVSGPVHAARGGAGWRGAERE